MFLKYNGSALSRSCASRLPPEETQGYRVHAMTRIRALLRNLAAFRKFNRTFCLVCLFSGTLTGILLSITAFREWLLHEAPVALNVGGYAALRISTR